MRRERVAVAHWFHRGSISAIVESLVEASHLSRIGRARCSARWFSSRRWEGDGIRSAGRWCGLGG